MLMPELVTIPIVWAEALVEWLWDETHALEVVGSNPANRILDEHFAHI